MQPGVFVISQICSTGSNNTFFFTGTTIIFISTRSSFAVWKNPNINLLSDGIHTKLNGNTYYPSGGFCVGILVRMSLFQGDLSVLFTTLNGSHQNSSYMMVGGVGFSNLEPVTYQTGSGDSYI